MELQKKVENQNHIEGNQSLETSEVYETMWDLLVPSKFDDVVKASIEVALPFMDDDEDLKVFG